MRRRSNKKLIIAVIVVIIGALCLGGIIKMREINEEKSVSMDGLNSIQVDLTSIGVHFISNKTNNEIKVSFHGKAMQEIKLISKTDNNTLFLTVQRKHENLPLYEDVVLDVYIPETYTKNLSIKILSGAVKMDSLKLENFTLDTSSGKLEADKINANEITITSSSGSIRIKSADTKELKMIGKSSSISIEECIAKKAEMETYSGNITLKNSVGNFNLKSNSGKVLVDYKDYEDQNVNIETSSGSITLGLPAAAEFLLKAKTASGSFKSEFPIEITDKKNVKGQIGTKRNEIMFQTSSGSMNILKK